MPTPLPTTMSSFCTIEMLMWNSKMVCAVIKEGLKASDDVVDVRFCRTVLDQVSAVH